MPEQSPSLVHSLVTSVKNELQNPIKPDLSKKTDQFSSPAKPRQVSYRDYSLLRCQAEYSSVESAYDVAPDDTKWGRVSLLRSCRQGAHFAVNSETREVRVISHHCSLRWCPMCSASKRYFVTEAVTKLLHKMQHPKMITFTLRHTNSPLADQVSHLYESFKRLRKMKPIIKKITGGVWFFQIKLSQRSQQWHPHLHILVDGDYIAQRYLSNLWRKASYGSYVVYIEKIKNIEKAAEYVARYATRPAMLSYYSPDEGVRILTALHGRRICGTWGIGQGTCMSIPKNETEGSWYRVGQWFTVMELGSCDDNAKAILYAWKTDTPLLPGTDMQHIENCDVIINPHPPPEKSQPCLF